MKSYSKSDLTKVLDHIHGLRIYRQRINKTYLCCKSTETLHYRMLLDSIDFEIKQQMQLHNEIVDYLRNNSSP